MILLPVAGKDAAGSPNTFRRPTNRDTKCVVSRFIVIVDPAYSLTTHASTDLLLARGHAGHQRVESTNDQAGFQSRFRRDAESSLRCKSDARLSISRASSSEMCHLIRGACAVVFRKVPKSPFRRFTSPMCSLRSV
jgi:hypothetical protein